MVLSQRIHEAFKGTMERITGPRTVSSFKEKGVLSVSSSSSPAIISSPIALLGLGIFFSMLPFLFKGIRRAKQEEVLFTARKEQYLITRNVPCLRRAASVEEEYEAAGGEVFLDNEDSDGWLVTHGKPKDRSDVE
ncbi:hypothetical protein CRYUN_Cryun23aG0156300 [Craigia yunnanensis]